MTNTINKTPDFMTKIELAEKIINVWKKNYRYDLITISEYRDFLTGYFNVSTAQIKGKLKTNVADLAMKYLNADTLIDFADHLSNFGLLIKDIAEIFGTSEYRVKKID